MFESRSVAKRTRTADATSHDQLTCADDPVQNTKLARDSRAKSSKNVKHGEVLTEALKDENNHVVISAASALSQIDPAIKDTVPALIAALKDKDIFVRKRATIALGQVGPAAQAAVPALKSMSKSDMNLAVRDSANAAQKKIEK